MVCISRLFLFILWHDELLIPFFDRLWLARIADEHLSRIRLHQNIMEARHSTSLEHIVWYRL